MPPSRDVRASAASASSSHVEGNSSHGIHTRTVFNHQSVHRCLAREIRSACENIARCDLLTPHEGALGEICGFAISLPDKQSEKKPYLLLSRNGASYTMEIGRTVQGNMRRFSNFFAAFGKQADAKRRTLDEEKARLTALKQQLSSPLVYDKKLAAAKTEYDSLIEDMRENIYAQ